MLVNISLKKALTTTFSCLAIALVLIDVRNNRVIEAHFASFFGIESLVCVEESILNVQS